MKRRHFLQCASMLGLASLVPGRRGQAAPSRDADLADVDPYFLESGDLTETERQSIDAYLGYLEDASDGRDAIIPRGGRPKRAPTYRFLRYTGELGDPYGRFVGPLRTRPELPEDSTYRMNAQILGFHGATDDWGDDYEIGALSVEARAGIRGELMTWLYAERFEIYEDGATSLGLEYVAQRDGRPEPIATDSPNIDLRIQLLKCERQKSGFLGKVFRVASSLVTGAFGGGAVGQAAEAVAPTIRVPQMVQEGVAFSQAVFGGMTEEAPIWRSGFTSFGLARGGSRLGLSPGLWVALDETRQLDLRGCYLDDLGGRVGLMREGAELDVNYLVLSVEVREGPLPDIYYAEPPAYEDYDDGDATETDPYDEELYELDDDYIDKGADDTGLPEGVRRRTDGER